MKLKLNNNIKEQLDTKINEAEATNTQNAPVPEASHDTTNNLKELIGEKLKDDINKKNLLFSFNLPSELFDDIEIPTAPASYKGLMTDLGTPEKFKNTHNMIPDPTGSVNGTQDKAKKYFSSVEFKLATPSTVIKAKEKSDEPKDNAETENTNESYSINEGIFDHVLHGFKNNKELDKETTDKFSNDSKGKSSKNKNVSVAINNYLQALTGDIKTLLQISLPKSNKNKVSELMKKLSYYVRHTETEVSNYIKSQDDFLQKSKENELKKAQIEAKETKYLAQEKMDAFLKINQSSLSTDAKSSLLKKIMAANTSSKIEAILKSDKGISTGPLEDSIQYSYTSRLNEGEDTPEPEFKKPEAMVGEQTFTDYYNTIISDLQSFMEEIMSGDPEELADVQWAKKEMEELKAKASEEVNKRIDVICRTNGGQDMSSKISAFLKKHPLRAEGLKRLWSQHEKDLDMRIKNRIDSMTSYQGGLGYCNEVITKTIPQLYATLLTYKAILLYLEDANCYCATEHVEETFKTPEEAVENTTTEIIDFVKAVLTNQGDVLNENEKFVNNGAIENGSVPYAGTFLYKYASTSKSPITSQTFEKFSTAVQSLHDAGDSKNLDAFAESVITYMVNNGATLDSLYSDDSVLTDAFNFGDMKADIEAAYNVLKTIIVPSNNESSENDIDYDSIKTALAAYYANDNKEPDEIDEDEIDDISDEKASTAVEKLKEYDINQDKLVALLKCFFDLNLQSQSSTDLKTMLETLKAVINYLMKHSSDDESDEDSEDNAENELKKILADKAEEKMKILNEIANLLKANKSTRLDMGAMFEILYEHINIYKNTNIDDLDDAGKADYNEIGKAIDNLINIINTSSDEKWVTEDNILEFCKKIKDSGVVPTVMSIIDCVATACGKDKSDINVIKTAKGIVENILIIDNIEGTALANLINLILSK